MNKKIVALLVSSLITVNTAFADFGFADPSDFTGDSFFLPPSQLEESQQPQEEKKRKEKAALKGEQLDIAWGSQIRSYVFHPYSMVKDHRTNYETADVNGVMDGKLDPFIYAYLQWRLSQENPD